MRTFKDCRTYHTGLNKPHTIDINGRLTSIEYGDCLKYYTEVKQFKKYATATDTRGNKYTVYAKDFPLYVIAIPEKGDN